MERTGGCGSTDCSEPGMRLRLSSLWTRMTDTFALSPSAAALSMFWFAHIVLRTWYQRWMPPMQNGLGTWREEGAPVAV
jgi:hypothetical protein